MKTITLLYAGLAMLGLVVLATIVLHSLNKTVSEYPFVLLFMLIAYGLNVAGIFVGFVEERKSRRRFLVGVIGNGLLTAFYLYISIYAWTMG